MFWKKKPAAGEPKAGDSPKDIITNQIEQLTPGQTLSYRLPETYGDRLAVIELNLQYLKKGQKKYILSLEELVDGKPTGKRRRFLDSNKPKDLAGWILDRDGELL
jgi:hypothetical protein